MRPLAMVAFKECLILHRHNVRSSFINIEDKHMNAENIAENLKSLGYGANAVREITDRKSGEVRDCSRVYLATGSKNVTAYLDLDRDTPALQVFANHADGYKNQSGDELAATKKRAAAMTREALKPAVMAAYLAEKDGVDLEALSIGFGLENRNDYLKPYERSRPDQEGEEPEQTAAQAPQPASQPGR